MSSRILAVIAGALLVSGCSAGFSRLGTYGYELADAKTVVDGRAYSLYVHPTDDTILVQRAAGAAMGQAIIEGSTFGAIDMTEPKPFWKRAAEWLANPLNCAVTDAYMLEGISWEAPFTCPAGVDIRAEVAANRETLRQGTPLAKREP